MSAARKRPRLEDLPPLMSLPQVAAFFGFDRAWCHDNLDRDACVLHVGNKVLPVFRQGRYWKAWRADLAELVGEKVM